VLHRRRSRCRPVIGCSLIVPSTWSYRPSCSSRGHRRRRPQRPAPPPTPTDRRRPQSTLQPGRASHPTQTMSSFARKLGLYHRQRLPAGDRRMFVRQLRPTGHSRSILVASSPAQLPRANILPGDGDSEHRPLVSRFSVVAVVVMIVVLARLQTLTEGRRQLGYDKGRAERPVPICSAAAAAVKWRIFYLGGCVCDCRRASLSD